MRLCTCLTGLVAAAILAPAAGAAQPEPPPPALALLPNTTLAFVHIPSIRALDGDLKQFGERTGWQIGAGDHPVLDLLARRTGINAGIDLDGSACIGFMDPKRFRQRYTLYVLPVSDWDALLKTSGGEEMSPGLYALTGTAGPRFVARRDKFAIVTSSIRTMDALAEADGLAASLPEATLARARGRAPTVYVNIDRLAAVYESDIASWFRMSSGQIYADPNTVAYADMVVAYLYGIADFIDQLKTVEASLVFKPEGLAMDLAVTFDDGSGVARFLSAQAPGGVPMPAVTDRPVASAVTLRLAPTERADLALRATRFFLESAPRPEPLPEPTKETVYNAVREFVESLGENMTFLSAPAAPGMGMESAVTVLDVTDAERFLHSVELLASAWERLADQLDLYLKFKQAPEVSEVDGTPVVMYLPRLRFGMPARHVEFRKRLQAMYGPEGLVYRIATVGNRAVIATGSDLSLFRKVLEQLKKGEEPQPSPGLQRLHQEVPRDQNLFMALSLPVYLGQSLARGGTPPDRIGSVDPGHELVGIGLRARGAAAELSTYWPHEQIRLARELLNRAAPELGQVPESLFEPSPEGPPKQAPPVPPPGNAAPEKSAPEKAPAPAG